MIVGVELNLNWIKRYQCDVRIFGHLGVMIADGETHRKWEITLGQELETLKEEGASSLFTLLPSSLNAVLRSRQFT